MIDMKELAEANQHCLESNCDGCPFKDKESCHNRDKLCAEVFADFVGMIWGYDKENISKKEGENSDDNF